MALSSAEFLRDTYPMKIVIDQSIRLPQPNLFHGSGVKHEVADPSAITAELVKDASALLVSTRVAVNQALLAGSQVRWVASAASGHDHLDTHWLTQQGIQWATAHGCNAMACAQYVLAVIASLQTRDYLPSTGLKVGVIGVGAVGSLVVKHFKQLGYQVLCCDPLRAEQQPGFTSTAFELWRDLDCVCLHVPLTHHGRNPTYHMINDAWLRRQSKGCVIINAARGDVVSQQAMLNNSHCYYCLDVWPGEPNIDPSLLAQALLATPHIAGYSAQAKYRALTTVCRATSEFFNWPYQPLAANPGYQATINLTTNSNWQSKVLTCYDPTHDHRRLQQALANSENTAKRFNILRSTYALRQEFLLAY